jgi:hypothetical protein
MTSSDTYTYPVKDRDTGEYVFRTGKKLRLKTVTPEKLTCPVCHFLVAIGENGQLRSHHDMLNDRPCPGAGELPVEAPKPEPEPEPEPVAVPWKGMAAERAERRAAGEYQYQPGRQRDRGPCSSCLQELSVRADGTMIRHRRPGGGKAICPGAGKPPGGAIRSLMRVPAVSSFTPAEAGSGSFTDELMYAGELYEDGHLPSWAESQIREITGRVRKEMSSSLMEEIEKLGSAAIRQLLNEIRQRAGAA